MFPLEEVPTIPEFFEAGSSGSLGIAPIVALAVVTVALYATLIVICLRQIVRAYSDNFVVEALWAAVVVFAPIAGIAAWVAWNGRLRLDTPSPSIR